jgi:DNA-binding NtrC family response regulator
MQGAANPVVQDRRILLVEDDDDTRTTLADLLRARGAEVTEAISGDQALTLMGAEETFDLVIIDVVMGGPFGTQVAAMARTAEYQAPMLVITGHRSPEIYQLVEKLERVELLYKPFPADTFLDRVDELLGQPAR